MGKIVILQFLYKKRKKVIKCHFLRKHLRNGFSESDEIPFGLRYVNKSGLSHSLIGFYKSHIGQIQRLYGQPLRFLLIKPKSPQIFWLILPILAEKDKSSDKKYIKGWF